MPSRHSSMLLFHIIRAQAVCVCVLFCKMPAARNEAREAAVKALNKIALDNDIPRVSTNAGRPRVDGLLVSLRDHLLTS